MTTTDIWSALASITWEDAESWLAYLGAVVAIGTFVAAGSLKGARALHAYALTTPTKSDDHVTAALVKLAEKAASGLALVAAWLPQITVGLGDARRTLDAIKLPKRPSGRGASALLILLVVLPFANISSGCATTQMERARAGIGFSVETMGMVDDTFEPRFRAAMARAESGGVPEAEVEAFTRRWRAAGIAIVSAVAALRTAETALDAIERGGEGDIAGVMSCVGVAVIDVIDKLPTVGIEIPPLLDVALRFVMGIAQGRCTPADHAVIPEGTPSLAAVLR